MEGSSLHLRHGAWGVQICRRVLHAEEQEGLEGGLGVGARLTLCVLAM